jgi:hypothetical protein
MSEGSKAKPLKTNLVNVLSHYRRSPGEKLRVPSILPRCVSIKRAISHPWIRTER